MPTTPHIEKHFTSGAIVRDVVIGMSDGLTVPFALAAGLSGAVLSSGIIITAGLAEIAAGGIAMGLGGYLAGRSDVEHYASEYAREVREIEKIPEHEKQEVYEILEEFGLKNEESKPIVESLAQRHDDWVKFMMKFELGLEEPNPRRAMTSGITIGGAYVIGGLIPLAPYFLSPTVPIALFWSTAVTIVALFVFGFVKGKFTGVKPIKSALQTCLIGSVAAGVAFLVAKWIS